MDKLSFELPLDQRNSLSLSNSLAGTDGQEALTAQVTSLMDKLHQLSLMLQAKPSIEAFPIPANQPDLESIVLIPKGSEDLPLATNSSFHPFTQLMIQEQNRKIEMFKKLMRSVHDVLARMEQSNALLAKEKLFLEGVSDILEKTHAESLNILEKQTQVLENSILSNHQSLLSRIKTIAQGQFPGVEVIVQEENNVITVTHTW